MPWIVSVYETSRRTAVAQHALTGAGTFSPKARGPARPQPTREQSSDSGVFRGSRPLTLVLDADIEAALKLVTQLNAAGFRAAATFDHPDAHAALARTYYHALVVTMDIELASELERLEKLRRASPQTWIIVASAQGNDQARRGVYRRGGDALVSLPFSVEELWPHLATFTARSRSLL